MTAAWTDRHRPDSSCGDGVYVTPGSQFAHLVVADEVIAFDATGPERSHGAEFDRQSLIKARRIADRLSLPLFIRHTDLRRSKPYRWVETPILRSRSAR